MLAGGLITVNHYLPLLVLIDIIIARIMAPY